jgi:amidase
MLKYANSTHAGLNTGIPAVCGPLARSVRDLKLLTKIARDDKPWLTDPSIIPYVFEHGTVDRKPVVGVIYQSDTLTPHPPIRRALRETVEKLKAAGLEVKEFIPPSYAAINEVTRQLFTLDGLSYAKRELAQSGEPPVASVRSIGFWDLPEKTSEENWAWNAKKQKFQKEMLDKWTAAGIDIVLCPAGAHTALLPREWTNDSYTVTWNALDYPAVIVPISHVDPAKDLKDSLEKPLSPTDAEFYAKYDPELMAGAPISLQLVGPRLEDEQLLQDVELIDTILRK